MFSSEEVAARRTQIVELLQSEYCNHIPVEEISDELRLVDDLGMDSLDVLELVITLEEKFDIEIPDSDIQVYDPFTVGRLKHLVETKVTAKHG